MQTRTFFFFVSCPFFFFFFFSFSFRCTIGTSMAFLLSCTLPAYLPWECVLLLLHVMMTIPTFRSMLKTQDTGESRAERPDRVGNVQVLHVAASWSLASRFPFLCCAAFFLPPGPPSFDRRASNLCNSNNECILSTYTARRESPVPVSVTTDVARTQPGDLLSWTALDLTPHGPPATGKRGQPAPSLRSCLAAKCSFRSLYVSVPLPL
ncbi:hypothetical protein MAPG_08869, partial [Magnaporthiopsis poae ATCC 64411]